MDSADSGKGNKYFHVLKIFNPIQVGEKLV